MLVSIIIPVYNRPALVANAIESVMLQTYQNWELIVVDDQSTDNTWNVLEDYAQKDPRIKIFKRNRKPKGASVCRNIGASMASGKYLIFLDSDDLLMPWCLNERVEFMEKNSDLDFGLFQLLNQDEKNHELTLRCYPFSNDYLKRFLSFKATWQTSAVIWAKSFFDKVGGWDEEALSWQDGEVHIRALLEKPLFYWGSLIPDGVIRSGNSDDRITESAISLLKIDRSFRVYNKLISKLGDGYKIIFTESIKARIWLLAYYQKFSRKKQFALLALESGFFIKKEYKRFLLISWVYEKIFSRVPGLKWGFYKLFIEKHFKGREFFKRVKLNDEYFLNLKEKIKTTKPEFQLMLEKIGLDIY